jgi:glycosyltransferase involved in cell wall biosynthesis
VPITPVLLIGDSPSCPSGLGRILREIAIRADAHLRDKCRVASLGCGGPGSRQLHFQQYAAEGVDDNFVIKNLPEVWDDWAGDEPGVILCVWDVSRLGWLSRPKVMCEEPSLRNFLVEAKIKRWIYAPVDAEGPRGSLTYPLQQALSGFDRILGYSKWSEGIIRNTLGDEASKAHHLTSIPHGIDSKVFFPRDRASARLNFLSLTGVFAAETLVDRKSHLTALQSDEPLIGAVATNQARKNWGLWAEACSLFLERHPKARFWIHTDKLERYWSIPALLVDFNLIGKTLVSLSHLEDDTMAKAYSACDLTMACGPEGFGFPIFESLFCGTPCIHGNYGGAPEHMADDLLVNPVAYHHEGLYSSKRPVYSAKDWVVRMESALGHRVTWPVHLGWEAVWPQFETWFRNGLA